MSITATQKLQLNSVTLGAAPSTKAVVAADTATQVALDNRGSLWALSRADFSRLPMPKKFFEAENWLFVFADKYAKSVASGGNANLSHVELDRVRGAVALFIATNPLDNAIDVARAMQSLVATQSAGKGQDAQELKALTRRATAYNGSLMRKYNRSAAALAAAVKAADAAEAARVAREPIPEKYMSSFGPANERRRPVDDAAPRRHSVQTPYWEGMGGSLFRMGSDTCFNPAGSGAVLVAGPGEYIATDGNGNYSVRQR